MFHPCEHALACSSRFLILPQLGSRSFHIDSEIPSDLRRSETRLDRTIYLRIANSNRPSIRLGDRKRHAAGERDEAAHGPAAQRLPGCPLHSAALELKRQRVGELPARVL